MISWLNKSDCDHRIQETSIHLYTDVASLCACYQTRLAVTMLVPRASSPLSWYLFRDGPSLFGWVCSHVFANLCVANTLCVGRIPSTSSWPEKLIFVLDIAFGIDNIYWCIFHKRLFDYHYSSMALQSNVDLRSVLWHLFPIYNFAFTNICLYTIPPFDFGSSSSWLPWGLLLNTWITFLLPSFLLTWPVQFNQLVLTIFIWLGTVFSLQTLLLTNTCI